MISCILWRLYCFVRYVGRRYDCLPDSPRMGVRLSWELACIMSGPIREGER